MSSVAILMRTKNSDWVISQTLSALFSQVDINFNLYIIDSGSTDQTIEIFSKYNHTRIPMPEGEYIPGPVINHSIEHIKEEIIIMLNSDSVLLQPNALKDLINPLLRNKEIVATVGRQLPRHDAEPWVRKDYAHSFPEHPPLPSYMYLSFPLSAFKRSLWEKEKFYNKSWGSEDTEWGKRVLDKKLGEIKYVPQAITMHSHNYNFKELHNRKFIEGEADYFISNTQPNLLRAILQYLKRCMSELLFYLKAFEFTSIPKIFIRNIYYFLGYYRGLKSAKHRETNNIENLVHKSY